MPVAKGASGGLPDTRGGGGGKAKPGGGGGGPPPRSGTGAEGEMVITLRDVGKTLPGGRVLFGNVSLGESSRWRWATPTPPTPAALPSRPPHEDTVPLRINQLSCNMLT